MEESCNYVQILMNTLEKQKQVLQQILTLTKEQSRIASQESFDENALEDTLNKKEILIARLNELDDGFASIYGRVRREVIEHQVEYAKELEKMQNLIRECTDIGNELKVLEQRNKDRLINCFAGKQKEYGARQTAANVASRYHQTMYNQTGNNSFYFNKKN